MSSLRFRILIPLILVVSAVLGALGVYSHRQFEAEITRSFVMKLANVAPRIALGAATPLWEVNRDAVKDVIEGEFSNSAVKAIFVLDERDNVFVAIRRSPSGLEELTEVTAIRGETTERGIFIDATRGGQRVGLVRVHFVRDEIDRAISANIQRQAVQILAVDAVIAILLHFSFGLMFAPLRKLRAALIQLSEGGADLSALGVSKYRELAEIETAFNGVLFGWRAAAVARERALQAKTMSVELSKSLQSTTDTKRFADLALRFLLQTVGASLGRFFVRRSGSSSFEYVAGVGVSTRDAPSFEIGDGPLGEAASSGKSLIWANLVGHDVRIDTSLVSLVPRAIAIVPIRIADETLGLIEIGFLEARQLDDGLLTEVVSAIAYDLDLLLGRQTTEREVAERLAAEKRLRLILSSVDDGIAGIDANGSIVFINEAGAKLLGAEAAHWIGKSFPDLADAASADGAVSDDGSLDMAVLLPRLGGAPFPAEFSETAIEIDGTKTGSVISFRDISERIRMERAVRDTERWYRRIVGSAPDGLVVVKPGGTIVLANAQAEAMFGFEHEELLGASILQLIRGTADESIEMLLAGRPGPADETTAQSGQDIQLEGIKRGGKLFPIELSVARLPADGSRGVAVCLSIRDITDRKAGERALIEARAAAEEATRAKSSFLAMMSHEIRTPMNGIMSMAEMLGHTRLDDDQRDMTGVILSSSDALLTIINDILDFSKIEAGKLDIESIPFDPVEVIESVGELISQRAFEKGVDLLVDVDDATPSGILGDPNRVRQVLLNLAGNAVKFTAEGHVRVAVRAVDEDAQAGRSTLRFEVTDTGIGMTDEQAARLFQPFQQADVSTSRKFGGTGLGLSICKRLSEMMGGQIGAKSKPGEGSTFWVEIPFAISARERPRPPSDISDVTVCLAGFEGSGAAIATRYARLAGAGTIAQCATAEIERTVPRLLKQASTVVLVVRVVDSALASELQERVAVFPPAALRLVVAAPRAMISTIRYVRDGGAHGILPLPISRGGFARTLGAVTGRLDAGARLDERSSQDAEWEAPGLDEAREAGVLILVAEDNKTNQTVIRKVLSRLGFAHEIAGDGREALEKFERGRYGLLLTDYHMPHMDGFALTGAIRRSEDRGQSRLPIVALTADAMASTERQCLDAGMDGFLTKPIKVDLLAAAIEKWIPGALALRRRPGSSGTKAVSAAAGSAVDSPPPSDDPLRNVDPDIFDASSLVETFGKFDKDACEFLESFGAELPGMIERVRAEIAKGALPMARDEAHTLKGASRSIGANRIGNLASDIQDSLDAGSLKTAEFLASALPEAQSEFLKAIETIASSTRSRK